MTPPSFFSGGIPQWAGRRGTRHHGVSSGSLFLNTIALRFNGVDEVLSGGDVLDFEASTTPITIVCHYKTTQTTQGCMVAKSNGEDPNSGYLIHNERAATLSGALVHEFSGATPYNAINVRSSTGGYNDGAKRCAVVAKSAGNSQTTVALYMDDMVTALTKVVNSNDLTRTTLTDAPFCVGGRDYPSSPIQMFIGDVKDVSIWNIELTEAQRGELLNGTDPANLSNHSAKANCLAWYQMGNGTGDTASLIVNQMTPGTYDLTCVNMDITNQVAW